MSQATMQETKFKLDDIVWGREILQHPYQMRGLAISQIDTFSGVLHYGYTEITAVPEHCQDKQPLAGWIEVRIADMIFETMNPHLVEVLKIHVQADGPVDVFSCWQYASKQHDPHISRNEVLWTLLRMKRLDIIREYTDGTGAEDEVLTFW